MANKIIQLKDGNDSLYPASFNGTWSPQIYDYETLKVTLTNGGEYIRIGSLLVCGFSVQVNTSITFNTMVQVKGFPFNCRIFGGNMYCAGATNQFGNCTVQMATNAAFLRPNYTGTISSGMWWSGLFVGIVS